MRHGSEGKSRDIISMEEYLKKRQAINSEKNTKKEGQPLEAAALQLADFCMINPFFSFCLAGTEKGNRNTAVFPQKLSGLYSYSIPELKVYGKHKLVYNEQAGRAILSA